MNKLSVLLFLAAAVSSPWTASAAPLVGNDGLEEQPRNRKLAVGSAPPEKRDVDCSRPDRLTVEGDEDYRRLRKNSRRGLSYIQSSVGADDDEVGCEEEETAEFRAAVQVGDQLICDPNYELGDNPCVDGCGHAPVPNPFNPDPVEAESEQVPSPCLDYTCLCADSGCKMSWDVGCIKWYMQCQTQTQVCGDLADAPTAVQDFNFGQDCTIAPISANTDVCFFQPLATPLPTSPPTMAPTSPPFEIVAP